MCFFLQKFGNQFVGSEIDGRIVLLRACLVGAQIIDGVAHMTQHGVVHGDMKTINVIVDDTNNQAPRIVIVDYGCARIQGDGVNNLDEGMAAFGTVARSLAMGNMPHHLKFC